MLGMARDQAGETAAALLAFDEAVRLAPFYSQPRWQRGNVLLRSGRYDEAFVDLNLAVRSNPELAPTLIDLAWNLSKGDVKLTEQLAQIDREKMRIAFAKFLARQGKATEAVAQIRGIATLPDEVSHELLERLVAKGAFKEAFDVWQQSNGTKSDNQPMGASIYDGGFEGPLSLDEVGFGWRVPRPSQAVAMSLDLTQPHTGSKSLRIDFGGNSNPDTPLVSQLILVEPSKYYRINFAARSQDIVTGGLPLAVIIDAAGERKPLGQSLPLAKGSVDWRVWSVEFRTPPTTNGIVVGLQRENCTTSPCPIFGSIWLDSFSLEQLN
jgi:hypothetical protein